MWTALEIGGNSIGRKGRARLDQLIYKPSLSKDFKSTIDLLQPVSLVENKFSVVFHNNILSTSVKIPSQLQRYNWNVFTSISRNNMKITKKLDKYWMWILAKFEINDQIVLKFSTEIL